MARQANLREGTTVKWTRTSILGLVLVAALLAAALLSGCPSTTQVTTTQVPAKIDIGAFVRAWEGSKHAVPVTFAAQEAPCTGCHDGGAFAQGVNDPKKINRPAPFGPWVVATDCRACHTGEGEKLVQSGSVPLPTTKAPVKAGKGALCMKCHNERRAPNINASRREYPHYGSEAGVLTATGGMRLADFKLLTQKRHQTVTNACVYCHLFKPAEGASHAFKPDIRACKVCHKKITNFEMKAKADYDGNGTIGPFVDEVNGLMTLLSKAVLTRSVATTFTAFEGEIVFKSGPATITPAKIDKISYLGAYNWFEINHDKSGGIHNPWFTVTLLQETIRTVTGKPVPNAAIPKTTDKAPEGIIQPAVPTGAPPSGTTTGTP